MPLKYSVIIPAYNEERGIARAIEETRRAFDGFGEPYEILVVDDGSSDRTSEYVQHARLIRHEVNRGKGAAVRTGVAAAEGQILLFLDADLATHPSEFSKCIPFFETYDIVIGSRRASGANIIERQPWHRVIAGRAFNAIIQATLKLPFEDTQCGFKAFRASAKPIFNELTTSGWVFDVEVLARAMRTGMRITEVPVAWKNNSVSRVKLSHAPRIIRELLDIRRRIG